MRTIHLNLAARPYRNYRPVYAVVGAAALATAILLGYNLQTAYRYFVETKETRAQIAAIEEETARERSMTEAMEKRIGAIDVGSLAEQSKFINTQIRQRAFPWSALMSRLEKVLPGDVRLTGLTPQIDDDGTVALSLSCIGRRPDSMVLTLDRLFADPAFKNPFPVSDSLEPDGLRRFTISVTYLPGAPEAAR